MDLVAILDRSGSMSNLIDDAMGGYNSYVKKMKKEFPNATVTLVIFDDKYDEVYYRRPIAEIEELTDRTFYARGGTALNDSIVKIISKIKAEEDVDKDVAVFVMTDGEENSSWESSASDVKALIEKQEKEKDWLFTFAGANIDAFSAGGGMGFRANNTVNYDFSTKGMNKMFNSTVMRTKEFMNNDAEDGLSRGVNLSSYAESYTLASDSLDEPDISDGTITTATTD